MSTFEKTKIKIIYNDGDEKYITVKHRNVLELKKTVENISSVESVKGVELCIDVEEELEQKTEEGIDAVSCSDEVVATSQDNLDIF